MGWFRAVDKDMLGLLAAEISDLREQLRAQRQQAVDRENQLLDRILALSAPAALREVRRPPPFAAEPHDGTPRRIHFPGYQPSLRPPVLAPSPLEPEDSAGDPKAG